MNEKFKLTQISRYLSPMTTSASSQPSSSSSSSVSLSHNSQPNTPNIASKEKSKREKLSFFNLDASIISQPNPIKKSTSNSTSANSKYFQQEFKCPICSIDLTSLSEANRQHHVDQCLPAEPKKLCESSSSSSSKSNSFTCPICASDLKLLNDADRQQHVNQCLDKRFSSSKSAKAKKQKNIPLTDEQKATNEEMLQNAVPSCPICGKGFQSLNTRQNHMKKCAKTFHIKTESLVELVKKQQEGLEKDLARGIIPTGVYFIKKKVEKPKKVTESTNELNQSQILLQEASKKELKITSKKDSKANKKIKPETILQKTSDKEREIMVSKRFQSILANKIDYNQVAAVDSDLIQTKFSMNESTLWNKCKYFEESEESFYVKFFLESGKFLVGHQVFIDKLTQGRFSNVELLNTQTAFLLAELNEQTQENISLYYTQLEGQNNRSRLEISNLQFNKTNLYEQDPTSMNTANCDYTMETEELDNFWQPDYSIKHTQSQANLQADSSTNQLKHMNTSNEQLQPEVTDSSQINKLDETQEMNESCDMNISNKLDEIDCLNDINQANNEPCEMNVSPKLVEVDHLNGLRPLQEEQTKSLLSKMGLFDDNEPIQIETSKNETSKFSENDPHIVIDETIMSSSSSASSPVSSLKTSQKSNNSEARNNEIILVDSDSLESKESNILDQNLDTLDFENEEEEDADLVSFINKTSDQFILNSSNKKKRKSCQDLIALNENDEENSELSSKKFKQDNAVLGSDSNESIQFLDEVVESKVSRKIATVVVDETESSSLPSLTAKSNNNNNQFDLATSFRLDSNKITQTNNRNDSSSCEFIEESTNKKENKDDVQVLRMIEKSLNQTEYNAENNIEDDENALGDVWNNFEENNFDDFYNYNNNDIIEMDNEIDEQKDKSHESLGNHLINSLDATRKNAIPTVTTSITTIASNVNSPKNRVEYSDDDLLPEIIVTSKKILKENIQQTDRSDSENEPPVEQTESETESSMQTPIVTKKKAPNKNINKKQPSAASALTAASNQLNLTPMPEYTQMDTPNLKSELKRFGMKPLSKKQAVKKLVEIYEFTHRHKLKRSASCLDLNSAITSERVSTWASNSTTTNIEVAEAAEQMNMQNKKSKKASKNLKKTVSDVGFQRPIAPPPPPPPALVSTQSSFVKIGSKKTKPSKSAKSDKRLQDLTIDDHMLALANGDEEASDSDSELVSASQMSTQQKVSRKKKTIEEEELKLFIYDYIKNDEDIYLDVLNYVPLDYESLYGKLQVALAPLKVNNKTLMKILDEYCVTFTLKSLNTRGNLNNKAKTATQKNKK